MSNHQSAQSVAVTNALAGEPLNITITFPCSGDPETDFISGINALARHCGADYRMCNRVLRYLHDRFLEKLERMEKEQASYAQAALEGVKRQQMLDRLTGSLPPGQIISSWSGPGQPSDQLTTSSGMPGLLQGSTFAIHKNPDGSETRQPYSQYLANQVSLGHPPPLYPIPQDGTVPLPHPPEFAKAIQQRELERLLAQDKTMDQQRSDRAQTERVQALRAALESCPDLKPSPPQKPRTKSCPPPKELPPCDSEF